MFFGLAGVLVGAVSTVDAARTYYALHPQSVVADATVTQVLFREHGKPSGPSSRVMVEFVTLDGPVKEAVSVQGAEVGAHLRVTYDRENPSFVRLTNQAGSPDLWPGVPILLGGLLIAAIGMGLVWAALRRRTPLAAVA